jgi:hypothetical protein
MNELYNRFQLCDWSIYPIGGLGILGAVGVVAGVIAVIAGKRSRNLTLFVSLSMMSGSLAMVAVVVVARATSFLEILSTLRRSLVEDHLSIFSLGWAITENLMYFSLLLGMIPMVFGVALLGLGLIRRFENSRELSTRMGFITEMSSSGQERMESPS